jgi:alcohol dehydrogenase, propanol-preferring
MRSMRLLCCGQPLSWLSQVPLEPAPDQVLIEVAACGVCHSDLHIADGELKGNVPVTLGHEVTGTVVQLGSAVTQWKLGDRVGVPWVHWTCGECEWCIGGAEQLCARQKITGYTVDGGYADHMLAAASHMVRLPDALSFAQAAPLLCAGLTVYKALRSSGLQAGQRLVVFGIGGLGHLAVQLGRYMGATVIGIDLTTEKLALARECGATHAVNSAVEPADKVVRALGGAHVALVTPASRVAYELALRCVRPHGTVMGVGMPAEPVPVLMTHFAAREIRLLASSVGTRDELRALLDLAAAGHVRCKVETRPLDEANAALEDLRAGRVLGRVVLTPQAP